MLTFSADIGDSRLLWGSKKLEFCQFVKIPKIEIGDGCEFVDASLGCFISLF